MKIQNQLTNGMRVILEREIHLDEELCHLIRELVLPLDGGANDWVWFYCVLDIKQQLRSER